MTHDARSAVQHPSQYALDDAQRRLTRAQELLRNLAVFAGDLHSAEFLYTLAEVQNYVEENLS